MPDRGVACCSLASPSAHLQRLDQRRVTGLHGRHLAAHRRQQRVISLHSGVLTGQLVDGGSGFEAMQQAGGCTL